MAKTKKKRSKEVQEYWTALAEGGCIITGRPAIIHHAMGGSMKERGIHKGMGQKNSDWLVIPLDPEYHTGSKGVHTIGVLRWEHDYFPQATLIDQLCERYQLDLWELAKNE